LALLKKKLQQVRKDNQALTRYIHVGRNKEEARKKEEKARKKTMVVMYPEIF
jgi:hypothetical protein